MGGQSHTAGLTTAAQELHGLLAELAQHQGEAAKAEAALREQIRQRHAILAMSADGIDHEKVAVAKTVIVVRGPYEKAGQDRASVIFDATKQLATGEPIRPHYGDLWRVAFGTKDYDSWHGQRSDHEYGCGPRHGSTIFSVGLTPDVRKGAHANLTAEQIEAAIYYLTNIERVQGAEQAAIAKATGESAA